jgi:hypothetical protein
MGIAEWAKVHDLLMAATRKSGDAYSGMVRESHWEAPAKAMLDHMHEAAEVLGYRLVPKDAPDA